MTERHYSSYVTARRAGPWSVVALSVLGICFRFGTSALAGPVGFALTRDGRPVATIVLAIVSARFFASDPLFFTAGDGIGIHPEIMISKLMIIFSLDAVTIDLRVLRHFLEFIEHLRCIATRATVDPIITVRSAAAVALGTAIGVPAAPTAARLTIVHQISGILVPIINLVFLKS